MVELPRESMQQKAHELRKPSAWLLRQCRGTIDPPLDWAGPARMCWAIFLWFTAMLLRVYLARKLNMTQSYSVRSSWKLGVA